MAEYHVVWDVRPDANDAKLQAEALREFPLMAEREGVRLVGAPRFFRYRPDRFVAVAEAELDPFAGRRPPWESVDDYRADLADPASWLGEVA